MIQAWDLDPSNALPNGRYREKDQALPDGTDEVDIAAGSTVKVTGSNITAVITGSNETITIGGSDEHISPLGTGDTIIISVGSNDRINYSTTPAAISGHTAASAVDGAAGMHHVTVGTSATFTGGE